MLFFINWEILLVKVRILIIFTNSKSFNRIYYFLIAGDYNYNSLRDKS